MEIQQESSTRPSRRTFLEHGVLGVVGIALGYLGGKFFSPKKDKGSETVRLITADGKVVEVDRKHLPPKVDQKKASNQELKDWMEKEQKGI